MFFDHTAFADELSKIAAPRWKQVLRAGGLGADDVGRLTSSGVLDYGKEISGLARGNEALSQKLGVPVRSLREQVAHKARRAVREKSLLPAVEGLDDVHKNIQFGGASTAIRPTSPDIANVVVSKTMAPKAVRKVKGQGRKALDALLTRHELDEVRAAIRDARKGRELAPRFAVSRPPASMSERVAAKTLDVQRGLMDRAARSTNPGLVGAAKGMDFGAEQGMGLPLSKIPQGMVPGGKHLSPSVILRESQNVATLPPTVRSAMTPMRVGESRALAGQGLQYGQAAPKGRFGPTVRAMETS